MAEKAGKRRKKSRKPGSPPFRGRRYGQSATRPTKRKKADVSNKPKPWPYQAAEARDQSAESAAVIVREAESALELTADPNVLRRLGRIVAQANVILRLLESQGAKTRPGGAVISKQ